MTLMRAVAILAVLPLIAACSPQEMETDPVVLATPQGPVTCQLYTRSQVLWDRSIDRPATMGVRTADALCVAEGKREQWGVRPAQGTTVPAATVPARA